MAESVVTKPAETTVTGGTANSPSEDVATPEQLAELRALIPKDNAKKEEFRSLLHKFAKSLPDLKPSQYTAFRSAVAHLIENDL